MFSTSHTDLSKYKYRQGINGKTKHKRTEQNSIFKIQRQTKQEQGNS
jgi:hypothetical protein